jgi:hypothetical protein
MKNISKAIDYIARSNGAMNRCSEEDEQALIVRVFALLRETFPLSRLILVEGVLSTLTDEDLFILCDGEDTEMSAVYDNLIALGVVDGSEVPTVEDVLNCIFDNV